ncbi:DUF1349 domain-containing protein [Chromobacterium vaccinii]|uniref:DUF1349 domain-containing protein n=1 Tax=Chromobacterium vaccinii TaxID=1108595 RepID=A0ABV0FKI0_9NEIS
MADGASGGAGLAQRPETAPRIGGRLFQSRHCERCRFQNSVLTLNSEAGSDGFNIPGLHVADQLGTLLAPLAGAFTLAADVSLASLAKFDAAGLFVMAGNHRLKFGVEEYGAGKKIVSVHSAPYSDEANGVDVGDAPMRLFVSRRADVFSCYVRTADARVAFHRAVYVEGCPDEVLAGFCVQSPFSAGAAGRFTGIEISSEAMEHIRE